MQQSCGTGGREKGGGRKGRREGRNERGSQKGVWRGGEIKGTDGTSGRKEKEKGYPNPPRAPSPLTSTGSALALTTAHTSSAVPATTQQACTSPYRDQPHPHTMSKAPQSDDHLTRQLLISHTSLSKEVHQPVRECIFSTVVDYLPFPPPSLLPLT